MEKNECEATVQKKRVGRKSALRSLVSAGKGGGGDFALQLSETQRKGCPRTVRGPDSEWALALAAGLRL